MREHLLHLNSDSIQKSNWKGKKDQSTGSSKGEIGKIPFIALLASLPIERRHRSPTRSLEFLP
jgi:hypothetical protein